MNRVKLMLLAMTLTVVSGCAESVALIKANSTSMRMDIFEEITDGGIAPRGFSDLRLTATVKTHKPGIYSEADIHGTRDYKLLMNIDGQALLLRGSVQKENSEPMHLVDPEAGDGIRYRFNKKLRLKAGTHRVVVAFPDDEVAVEREMTLVEGDTNNLFFEPIYRSKPGNRRLGLNHTPTGFMEGIRTFRLTLNGQGI